jgi:hypothetical protein
MSRARDDYFRKGVRLPYLVATLAIAASIAYVMDKRKSAGCP